MINNTVITGITNNGDDRLFIDLDYENMFLDQEYIFDILLNNNGNESKININVLVYDIQNNKIEFNILAIHKKKYQLPEFIRFHLIWHYTGHYETNHISTFNNNIISDTEAVEYAKWKIYNMIIPCCFRYKQEDINNLN